METLELNLKAKRVQPATKPLDKDVNHLIQQLKLDMEYAKAYYTYKTKQYQHNWYTAA